MMRDVTGADVRKRPYRHRLVARDSASVPRLVRQVIEQRDGGGTDRRELVQMAAPRALVGPSRPNHGILIEAGQRSLEPASKPEGAEGEHALRVVDVADHLPDAPLRRRIAVERPLV